MWLKNERLRLRYTQGDVAQILGVTRPTYNKLEATPDELRVHQLRVLQAHGFDVSSLPGNGTAIACPACDGTGILYKAERKEV